MIQCKIFSGNDIMILESDVNKFIRDNPKILIDSIHQSADSNSLFITIFFHSRNKAARLREAAIEEIKVPITIPTVEKN